MLQFVARFASLIYGVLSGFDRIRFRGTHRAISHARGFDAMLHVHGVLLKDYSSYVESVTARLTKQVVADAAALGVPILYVERSSQSKEDLAAQLAAKAGRTHGLLAILKALEPCRTFEVRKNHELGRLELRSRSAKCLHYYHYWMHPLLGPCHVRMQTWFPFNVFVCVNGREMLARRMSSEGIAFRQRDNCFSWVEDAAHAQALLDEQVKLDWSKELTRLVDATHPQLRSLPGLDRDHYWTAEQTEWATDVMFRQPSALASRVPRFIEHSMLNLGCGHVMRFLGRRANQDGTVTKSFTGEVGADMTRRAEGTRVAFRVNGNQVKFYDKQGSVLRVETTINNPKDMQSYRASESDPKGPKKWRGMKKGVSDLPRRTEISQKSNERCLESLATVDDSEPVACVVAKVCRRAKKTGGGMVRALNPLGDEDAKLLRAIGSGDFLLSGFRNRDVRASLECSSAAATYRLSLLRAHKVIRKISGTHRYQVSSFGRKLLEALAKTQRQNIDEKPKSRP
jgi:hypothetical protein